MIRAQLRQVWLMIASLSTAVHLFGAGMLLLGNAVPLVVVVMLDVIALWGAGLAWTAARRHPERRAGL